jgi:hypothetical protein
MESGWFAAMATAARMADDSLDPVLGLTSPVFSRRLSASKACFAEIDAHDASITTRG